MGKILLQKGSTVFNSFITALAEYGKGASYAIRR